MKWVVGHGSATEVGRWSLVVAEVAPVMIFFEWVYSGGFQIDWVSNRRRGFLIGGFVGLMAWVYDRRGFDGLCLCLCVWLRKKKYG